MIGNIEELSQEITGNNGAFQYYVLLLFENPKRKEKSRALLEKVLSTNFIVKTISMEEEKSGYIPQRFYERLSNISGELQDKNPCVFVLGVEQDIDHNLRLLNYYRDLFRFNFPIIFFLPAILVNKFEEIAPDLFSLFGNNQYIVDELDTELSREDISASLDFYEKKHNLKSKEFYDKWILGEIEDTFENHNWALTYQLLELTDEDENQ